MTNDQKAILSIFIFIVIAFITCSFLIGSKFTDIDLRLERLERLSNEKRN